MSNLLLQISLTAHSSAMLFSLILLCWLKIAQSWPCLRIARQALLDCDNVWAYSRNESHALLALFVFITSACLGLFGSGLVLPLRLCSSYDHLGVGNDGVTICGVLVTLLGRLDTVLECRVVTTLNRALAFALCGLLQVSAFFSCEAVFREDL